MKGFVINSFGSPEVFEFREDLPKPEIGPEDVLVKVHATSVNPVDYKLRQDGSAAGIDPPAIIGYDVAGVVEEIGEDVTDLKVGDEVFYTPEIGPGGSYAEYHAANASIVAKKPENLSFAQAAAIPLAGATALDALVERAGVGPGETVLIHGCGGVGSFAVQIALAREAEVFVTCNDRTVEVAENFGATAIPYEKENFTEIIDQATDGEGVDVVFDTVGGSLLADSIGIVKPHGRMVGIVTADGDFDPAFQKNLTLHFMYLERGRGKLERLRELAEAKQLVPVIDSIRPLEELPRAHRDIEEGGLRGKIVLEVSDSRKKSVVHNEPREE